MTRKRFCFTMTKATSSQLMKVYTPISFLGKKLIIPFPLEISVFDAFKGMIAVRSV